MPSVSSMIDQIGVESAKRAADKAAGKTTARKPIFLFLKPGYKALIRPLYDLDSAIVLQMHDKYSDNKDYKVNAVCACENGQACEHCDTAKALKDRDLTAKIAFYIPVYVYNLVEVRVVAGREQAFPVTYEEEVDGRKVQKPVRGFRLIECFKYGKTYGLLKTLRGYEAENKVAINTCDWVIAQDGSGQGKTLTLTAKRETEINPQLKAAIPSVSRFRDQIFEARPPVVRVADAIEDNMSDDDFDLTTGSADTPAGVEAMNDEGNFEF